VTSTTQRVGRGVVLVVVLGALVVFAGTVNWTATWRAIRATAPGLFVVAAIVNLVSLALKGVRWWIFLRPIGVTSLELAMRATFAGAALNNLLVANTGEAGRTVMVARAAGVPSERVLATLALERLFELAGYVVLLALAVSFLSLPPFIEGLRPVAFAGLVLVALLLVYLARHPGSADPEVKNPNGWLERVKEYGRGFLRTLTGISTPRRFAASLVISIVVWGLQVATYQLTAQAAHFDISIVATTATILAVNTGFAARATPGNVGVFQMMYATAAAAFGLDRDQAIGVAFLIQVQQIVPATIIGLLASPGMLNRQPDATDSDPPTRAPGAGHSVTS
jgi:uncharacterized protein (TIRG00374 family)